MKVLSRLKIESEETWFDRMSQEDQKSYVDEHPNSKYADQYRAKNSEKEKVSLEETLKSKGLSDEDLRKLLKKDEPKKKEPKELTPEKQAEKQKREDAKSVDFILRRFNTRGNKLWMGNSQDSTSVKTKLKGMSEVPQDLQEKLVKEDSSYYRYIKNPSEETKKSLVGVTPSAINLISNPSVDLKEYAISRDPEAIRSIKNPTKEDIDFAIKNNAGFSALQDLVSWTPELVEKIALSNNSSLGYVPKGFLTKKVVENLLTHEYSSIDEHTIKRLKEDYNISFSDKELEKYIDKNPTFYYAIENPSKEVQRKVFVNEIDNLPYRLKYPSEPLKIDSDIQEEIAKKNPYAFLQMNIQEPSEEVKELAWKTAIPGEKNWDFSIYHAVKEKNIPEKIKQKAIEEKPQLIRTLEFPSEELQLQAIKKDKKLLKAIDNPSETIKALRKAIYGY